MAKKSSKTNRPKCVAYRAKKRRETNKRRKLAKHLKNNPLDKDALAAHKLVA